MHSRKDEISGKITPNQCGRNPALKVRVARLTNVGLVSLLSLFFLSLFFLSLFFLSLFMGASALSTTALAAANAPAPRLTNPPLPNSPLANSQEIELMRFNHPESGQIVRLTMPRASLEELRRYSPSYLRRDQNMRKALERQCAGRPGPLKQMIYDYPAEATAFNLALAASAENQMRGDPAALRHFVEQSITDPVAHVSFAGFMLASRATSSFLSMIGFAHDPCQALRRTPPGHAIQMKPNKFQRVFAPLIGPMGMSAGLITSSVIHEVISDQNLRLCAKGLISPVDPKKLEEACDKAYEEWTISRKLTQYAPDIFAMVATSFIQAYTINYPLIKASQLAAQRAAGPIATLGFAAIVGQNNIASISLRSLQLLWQARSALGGPWGHFAVMVGNVWVFLEINEFILPYIRNPWEREIQGRDITAATRQLLAEVDGAAKAGWAWQPAPMPSACTDQINPVDSAFAGTPSLPRECRKGPQTLEQMTRSLGEKNRKWRNFLLSDAFAAHSNWKDYVLRFTNMYTNAYSVYKDITYNINWHKAEGSRPGANPEPMYRSSPLNGVSTTAPPKICALDTESRAKIDSAITLARDLITAREQGRERVRSAEEISLLRGILAGLETVDCSKPLEELNKLAARAERRGTPLSHEQLNQSSEQIRSERFALAMSTLNRVLRSGGPNSDFGTPVDSPAYRRLAETNPFARLRLALGNPDPLAEGIAYLRDLNDDKNLVQQEHKTQHPAFIRNARTNSMTDYLLASMVCGPEASPSVATKVQMARRSSNSLTNRILNIFGLGRTSFEPSNPEEGLEEAQAAERVYADAANPKPTLLPIAPHPSSDVTLIPKQWGSRIDFRPPRIINDLGGDLCSLRPANAEPNNPYFDIHSSTWRVGGNTYNGFLEIVKRQARNSIVGSDSRSYAFPQWWEQNVDRHVHQAIAKMRQDFETILTEKFIPKMTSPDYAEFGTSTDIPRLGASRRPGHAFALGVINSIQDDAILNLNLLSQTLRARTQAEANAARATQNLMREFMTRFTLSTSLFGAPESRKAALELLSKELATQGPLPTPTSRMQGNPLLSAAYEQNKKALSSLIENLEKLTASELESSSLSIPSRVTIRDLRAGVFSNLKELLSELDSYFGIVKTLEIEGLE